MDLKCVAQAREVLFCVTTMPKTRLDRRVRIRIDTRVEDRHEGGELRIDTNDEDRHNRQR